MDTGLLRGCVVLSSFCLRRHLSGRLEGFPTGKFLETTFAMTAISAVIAGLIVLHHLQDVAQFPSGMGEAPLQQYSCLGQGQS